MYRKIAGREEELSRQRSFERGGVGMDCRHKKDTGERKLQKGSTGVGIRNIWKRIKRNHLPPISLRQFLEGKEAGVSRG